MKLNARLAKIESAAAKLPQPEQIDFESPQDRLKGEQIILASRPPEYGRHWARLGELTAIGAMAMTIPQCDEFQRQFGEMLRAGAAIHSG